MGDKFLNDELTDAGDRTGLQDGRLCWVNCCIAAKGP